MVLVSKGPCPKHAKRGRRGYDARRGSAHQRGYGVRWREKRDAQLEREPLCRTCAKAGLVVAAVEVDHVVPRELGGSDDDSNLQSLCKTCHSRKTATEDGGFGRPRAGARGAASTTTRGRGGRIAVSDHPGTAACASRTPGQNWAFFPPPPTGVSW